MAKKKYYAVQKGRVPGVYLTWDECKKQVDGFSGAAFKSFSTMEEARQFVKGAAGKPDVRAAETDGDGRENSNGIEDCASQRNFSRTEGRSDQERISNAEDKDSIREENAGEMEDDGWLEADAAPDAFSVFDMMKENGGSEAVAYVDGSYYHPDRKFSCGVVLFWKGREFHFKEAYTDPDLASMRNVAGEIKGAQKAMEYCLKHGISSLCIFHDYEGIAKWCEGQWEAKKEGTRAYRDFYRRASEKLTITFRKVKGHSGDTWNDLADRLAKEALRLC